MKIIKTTIKNVEDSFNQIKKDPSKIFFPLMVDVLFIFAVSFFVGMSIFMLAGFGDRFVPADEELGMLSLPEEIAGSGDVIANMRNLFSMAFTFIFIAVFVAPIILYFFHSIAQAINFYYHNKGNKISFWRYLGRHYGLNVCWILIPNLVITPIILSLLVKIYQAAPTSFTPNYLIRILAISYLILWIIAIYFAFISYPLALKNTLWNTIKKTFKFGIQKFPLFFLAYAGLMAAVLVIDVIMRLAGFLDSLIAFIIGFILFFPLISLFRILMMNTVNSVEK